MKRPLRFSLLASVALMGLGAGTAAAAPSLRVQVDQKGDFTLIGNTLGHDCAAGTPTPIVGDVGTCGMGTGDTAPDVFWRSDAPAAGQAQANNMIQPAQARSTAVLGIPAGATITHAYLYWGAYLGAVGGDDTVTLAGPGGFTANITADDVYQANNNNAYQSVADVTALVQANGPGAYRVSGIGAANFVNSSNDNLFGGWWMVVFYSLPSDPPRNLALFDGLDLVANGAPQSATIDGFKVPNAGFDGKLGVVTFEGDGTLVGDQLFFGGGAALTDAQNPADNFFNGTRSTLGVATSVAGDLPQLTGGPRSMSGMDLDVVDITAKLTAGQTSAPIQATSSGDVYYLAGWVTSITTFKPDFSASTKSAADANGGALLAGDVIDYTIVATNTGNDASVGTVLTDALPTGITYVPGSIQITAGPNAGMKSDVPLDDQAEYDAGTRTLTVRLGTGADGMNGGTLGIGESTTVTFQATVDAGTTGTISNQAIITAGGLLGAAPDDTPTDGNGGADGQPPTDVVIDLCEDDSQCGAPTPICDTGATPNVCVECVLDANCPGELPTCDPGTNTCVCIPDGVEICNYKDDDCNGTVDDGFDVGMTCTVGVGACAATATIQCSGMGEPFCPAEPGTPQPEVCDGADNDCNGTVDDTPQGCTDSDGDGLSDGVEVLLGTDPNDADSDDDGVPDGQEPSLDQDTDGDGLINALDPDSDNDGLFDGTEMGLGCGGAGTDAGNGTCIPDGDGGATTTDPLDPDTDDGGVSDGAEDTNLNGVIDRGETDPNNGDDDNQVVDSDGDGLSDDVEVQIGTNPNDADSDDDGVPDGQEPNPTADSDGDGLINALDPDSDNDGLFDGTEMGLGCDGKDTDGSKGNCVPDGDGGATTTSPLDPDTDDGGVSDGSEDTNLNGVVDEGETDPNDPSDDTQNVDTDGDGLSDAVEGTLGTDPNDADTDDDGVPDGKEPNPGADTDGDGKINALDPDSDDDGLFDGTEMGFGCDGPGTDATKGTCIPDGDNGTTTTSPVNPDTDGGSVSDGDEDANHNGVVDSGERDPNDASDDLTNPGTGGGGAGGTGGAGGGGAGGGGAGGGDLVVATGSGLFCAVDHGSGRTPDRGPLLVLATALALTLARRRARRAPARDRDAS